MNALCLSSTLHSNDEEMLIQLFPEAVGVCGKCREMHPEMFFFFYTVTGERSNFRTPVCTRFCYAFIIGEVSRVGFIFGASHWSVCVLDEGPSPSPQPIFLSTDTEGLQNKG